VWADLLRAAATGEHNQHGYSYAIASQSVPETRTGHPVQWVSYFEGGSAVHYIARGSYGYPQSLGCVELPYSAAAAAYPYLPYGTLVTVTP
jgi:hypothetical protein